MVEHTLDYDWAAVPQFLGYDVWLAAEERFASWDRTREVFDAIGLPTVPEVERVPVEAFPVDRDGGDVTVDDAIPESAYRDEIAEGVVLRNDDVGVRAKVVSEAFRERRDAGGGDSGAERVAERFCTPMWVRKAARRLRDEGDYDRLEMPMMEDLPMAVVEDVWAEEGAEIARTDWTVDMAELRSVVASRCVPVLKEMGHGDG